MSISGVVRGLLQKYLGTYIKGLDSDALSLGWSATELKDLELQESLFDDMGLPMVLHKGFVGKLKLVIPWAKLARLSSETKIVVELEDIYAIAVAKADVKYNAEEERKAALAPTSPPAEEAPAPPPAEAPAADRGIDGATPRLASQEQLEASAAQIAALEAEMAQMREARAAADAARDAALAALEQAETALGAVQEATRADRERIAELESEREAARTEAAALRSELYARSRGWAGLGTAATDADEDLEEELEEEEEEEEETPAAVAAGSGASLAAVASVMLAIA